jgi:hypothetical protein
MEIFVWVLHCSTEYGEEYRAFKTEEGARDALSDIILDAEFESDTPGMEYSNAFVGDQWALKNGESVFLSREPLLD